jgi:hypothetical protein
MSISYSLGIAKNSVNTPSSDSIIQKVSTDNGSQIQLVSFYIDAPSVGFNEYYPVEYVSAGVANVFSSNNTTDFGGIQAEWRC